MKLVTGTEGFKDYVLVARSQGMWLAVKSFLVRMPISWSCVVGLRYRGGHDEGLTLSDPLVNCMAWNIEWQKASLNHASASFPHFGINAEGPITTAEIMDALSDEQMEQLVLHVCARVDPRTRVREFDVETLKDHFRQIIEAQAKDLPPGQDIPDSIKDLSPEEILHRISKVMEAFLKSGAPSGFPYDKMGGPMGKPN